MLSLSGSIKPKAGNGATVLHYSNIHSSQSQLRSETAFFLPYRLAPDAGSLKLPKEAYFRYSLCFLVL